MIIASRPMATRRRRVVVPLVAMATTLGLAGGAPVASAHGVPSHSKGSQRLTSAERTVLRDATRRFRDVDQARAAGYLPANECVPNMGFHYANPKLAGDMNIDPTLPDVLVYEAAEEGSMRLVALEYFRADADGDKDTADDRPTLFGHPFQGPMDGHPVPAGAPPMPVHYDLHVWLYKTNPAGELSPENPRVHCPEAAGPAR